MRLAPLALSPQGTIAERQCDCLCAVVDAKLAENALDVGLHGFCRDEELVGDLGLVAALRQEPEHFSLTLRQQREAIAIRIAIRRRMSLAPEHPPDAGEK